MRRLLLATLLVATLPSSAGAATITATNFFSPPNEAWKYVIAMDGNVTQLTISAATGGLRVREAGSSNPTLTVSQPSTSPPGPPCAKDPDGSVVCRIGQVEITNAGGSTNPAGGRDLIVVAGSAHGDPANTWSPVAASLSSTSGLVEYYAGDAGGFVAGSDIAVGTADQPADIVHSGPGGLLCLGSTQNLCDLQGGADRLEGGSGDDNVGGGAGEDVLVGGGGADELDGGAGNDTIAPGAGSDTVAGADGLDTLSYDDPARPAGLTATFATGAAGKLGTSPYDDSPVFGGGTSSLDAYDASFERLVGSPLADMLTGGEAADMIDGAGGDDVLTGGLGSDTLTGGTGDDTLRAKDGVIDVLLCGAGTDSADADDGDAQSECEPPATPAPTVPAPTATPTPTPSPGPAPTVTPAKVSVKSRFKSSKRGAKVRRLSARNLPAGTEVLVRCANGCPFERKTRTVTTATAAVELADLFKGRRLRVGTRFSVTVTTPDGTKTLKRYRVARKGVRVS